MRRIALVLALDIFIIGTLLLLFFVADLGHSEFMREYGWLIGIGIFLVGKFSGVAYRKYKSR